MPPLVSVLMTAYNREKYIAEAIESVLAQSFTDFELIIVDDGSMDRTVEIARHYTKDPRVRVYLNDKNLGDYPNRNRAAELASGQFLKYLDADDILYPHGLDAMLWAVRSTSDAGLAVCDDSPPRVNRYPKVLSPSEAYCAVFLNSAGYFHRSPLSAILRTSCFWAVGGFADQRFTGDQELWMALAARYPLIVMPDGLGWWRNHGDQESTREALSVEPSCRRFFLLRKRFLDPTTPLPERERRRLLRVLAWKQLSVMVKAALRGNFRNTCRIWQRSGASEGTSEDR
jgi:glycosyltransferase involved in cell wall biosynthesis